MSARTFSGKSVGRMWKRGRERTFTVLSAQPRLTERECVCVWNSGEKNKREKGYMGGVRHSLGQRL